MKPTKKEVFDNLIRNGSVWIVLDPRAEGVVVPAVYLRQPMLCLRFGEGLKPPIPDLEANEGALSGTLTFKTYKQFCVIPWSAIFSIRDAGNLGKLWSESVPVELYPVVAGARPTPPKWTGERKLRLVHSR